MKKSIFKSKNIQSASKSNQSQNSYSSVSNKATSNAKSWNASSVSKKTKNQLKRAEKPFSSEYTDYLNQALSNINNRKEFSYDVNNDALYQQYAKQYKALGQQSMQETMANASALTGGYGSSYATTAGQQAFNGYMQQLNDVVPDLYSQARSSYDNETSELYNRASLYQGLESDAYNKFIENRSYYADKYNNEWNRNAVSYSKQTDTSNQTERSSSSSNSTQSDYVKPTEDTLVLPSYEERVDAAHSYNRTTSLMDTYGLSGNVQAYKDWSKNNKGTYTDYQNYLANQLGLMIDAAYSQKERKKSKNKG